MSKSRWIRTSGKNNARPHLAGETAQRHAHRRATTIRAAGHAHPDGLATGEHRDTAAAQPGMAGALRNGGLERDRAEAVTGKRGDAPWPAQGSETAEQDDIDCLGAEALVLSAALEDCLCHLVELYGPDILDSFLERCVNESIAPLLQEADVAGDTETLKSADAAARRLRAAVESVRNDPTPPASD